VVLEPGKVGEIQGLLKETNNKENKYKKQPPQARVSVVVPLSPLDPQLSNLQNEISI
jgi:hypothetical protein